RLLIIALQVADEAQLRAIPPHQPRRCHLARMREGAADEQRRRLRSGAILVEHRKRAPDITEARIAPDPTAYRTPRLGVLVPAGQPVRTIAGSGAILGSEIPRDIERAVCPVVERRDIPDLDSERGQL